MHFTSYLAALLLTLAPATLADTTALAARSEKKCSQLMVSYVLPCYENPCTIGLWSLGDKNAKLFEKAAEDFKQWTKKPLIGGTCPGSCGRPYRGKPKKEGGLTFFMDCFAARVSNKHENDELPAPPDGLKLAFMDTACHVFCDLKSELSCYFEYNTC